jgi:hydroxymethylpyrimidine/phosphomethylpyrimidine kinase
MGSIRKQLPCVLAIGELDPGGGDGVLADARAIARAGAFGCAGVAVLTVQSTSGMREATPVPSRELIAACTEVLKVQRVRAIKVGALGSDENARAVGDFLAIHREIPSVVDTVVVPTRGRARLLEERAVTVLRDRVLSRAALVTVNAPEAAALTGRAVTRLDDAHEAALAILRLGPRAVLVKGGHLGGARAVDVLVLAPPPPPPAPSRRSVRDVSRTAPRAVRAEPRVVTLSAPRLRLAPSQGVGCALASLLAGRIACEADAYEADRLATLEASARWAKRIHHAALAKAADVGGDLRVLFA